MTSNTIPFPHKSPSAHPDPGLADDEFAQMLNHGVRALQEAMDTAQLAGLGVEPSFARIDSFVCKVRVYRRLTRSITRSLNCGVLFVESCRNQFSRRYASCDAD